MQKKLFLITLLAFITGFVSASVAGEIDPGLESILDSKSPDQTVSALVFLNDQVDLQAITWDMDGQNATLKQRHETVVRALLENAETSQPDFIPYLSDLQSSGEIDDFKAFWIINAYVVEAKANVVKAISAHPDVARVYYNYEIELIEPVEAKKDNTGLITVAETGVQAVRAPEVWAMGYTGAGVLVSNIDTGVEGDHPALASRWAGAADPRYAGHPEWAWYDPYLGMNDFPYDYHGHGTHTMGSICGGSPGYDVGVAPGAFWIAAGAIDRGGGISRTVADAIASFQWMLDPDGNPSTNWDVPDVCSNSWGLVTAHGYPPCDELFWSYIDACEAAGTVVIFAAGNEGTSGLRRPADRATDDYRNCAVAAVDANNPSWPIASFSSRGPTYCTPGGSAAIKPDIAAPGVSVRSSYPGGGYVYMSGTSMATPHVAGVIALIREANPNLSVDQIKQIIYDSAYDLGPAGEDNSYGWGMIDAYEAVLLALGGAPPVADFVGSPTSGCAPLAVDFTDQSSGDITEWSWNFGDGNTSSLQNPSHTYQNAGIYTVSLTVTGPSGSDTETKTDYIAVEDVPVADFSGDPTAGCAPLTVSFTDLSSGNPNIWSWNFGDGGSSNIQNPDYTYQDPGTYTVTLTASNSCGSDIASKTDYIQVDPPCGVKSLAISDIPVKGSVSGDYSYTHTSDNVYEVLTEVESGGKPSKRYSLLEHKWNFNVTAGATITFNVEAYRPDNADGDDFTFEYSVNDLNYTPLLSVNSSAEQMYQALFPMNVSGTVYIRVTDTDQTPGNRSFDPIYIDYMYIESGGTPPPPDTMYVYSITVTRVFSNGNKYQGQADVVVYNQDDLPVVGALVEGHFSGPSGDSQSGMTGSDGLATILSEKVRNPVGIWCFTVDNIILGSNIYDPSQNNETSDCEGAGRLAAGLPSSYELSQNYPNPFNPVTDINLILPEPGMVTLEVYNIIGQKVSTLYEGYLESGSQTYQWNGSEFPSGVYFYRLNAAGKVEVRKMILLK
ncbi:MAG: S8 family serine peptidase [Candidatus Zixiibacteriota bacterium]|nr:MAG: S8 family serine peptidase [candidate division Zixibacteria bacterium]